ncbi:ankyrin repeat domain-containing protein 49-like [Leguminivora glycinivorella]|uniref:ankyrin repeat domain-containing protein 49-like n=1 Tax=Leguminivora glycinivorella TaxID=1035111 RepID=UPI00200C344B|nr:ankyrin repeat domain-containing protein 49-like [Leguminivora glycinivorella]
MSDSEESDTFNEEPVRSFHDIHDEIERCKKNPATSGMFVSGWDDADEGVEEVKDPKANPVDHVLWAAENADIAALKELLAAQPDLINAKDINLYTPLHRAAYGNHVTTITYLLSVGAKLDAKTEFGWTPLHSAANWNNYWVVARLLAAGADPAAVSEGDQTPLHLAAAKSHSKSTIITLLFQDNSVEVAQMVNNVGEKPEELARGHGIYAPLFEMVMPAASYIKSIGFTCNPYLRIEKSSELE